MKSTVRRWLPAIVTRTNTTAGLAALALAVGLAGGTAAIAATESPTGGSGTEAGDHRSSTAKAADAKAKAKAAAKAKAKAKETAKAKKRASEKAKPKNYPKSKSLKHSFQLQSTYYNCGPAATRVALSVHGKIYSQKRVGSFLNTTTNGTYSAKNVTAALNRKLGQGTYKTVMIGGQKASAKQVAKLRDDVRKAISNGDAVVANVAGTYRDDKGDLHSYEGGHYLPVVGYKNNGHTVRIADSADTVGSSYYTISTEKLANWIASRGYSA